MSHLMRLCARVCLPLLLLAGLAVAPPATASPHGGTAAISARKHQHQHRHAHKHHHRTHHHRHAHKHKHHHRKHHRVSRATRVLRVAASKRGTPYRWGATGPRAFDCSGYTRWVFARVGKHLPRTAAAQAAATRRIKPRAARKADLVFFASRGHVYHVGIYAGHGTIWHAPHTGAVVRRERIWTRARFFGRVR